MRGFVRFSFAVALGVFAAPAALAQAAFSNFPVNGQISAFQVNGGYSASNSFTLASGATIGEVSFGAWVTTGDTVTAVAWSIGTSAYDASLGSGVAGATSSYDFSNVDGFDVDTVTFPISSVTLPAGTYYLTLSSPTSAGSNPVYWDINDGPGIDAWNTGYGHVSAGNTCFTVVGISGTCASSFQLLSTGKSLSAAPASVAFANQTVNTASAAQTVTVSNTGAGAATIAGIAITGPNAGDFAQTNNCPISPATLASGGSCSINVTFTPQAASARAAAITVTGGSPLMIALSGTGTLAPSTVGLLPSSIAFANQTVNTASGTQTVTVTNSGPSPLTIGGISISGANAADFTETNNCPLSPATLAVSSSCLIGVAFQPLAAGARSASIQIADNGIGSPQQVSLSGTGVAPTAATWPNGYLYEATFTVAAGQVPSAQSNFPMLISGTYADFASTANGGRISNTCTQTVGNSATPVPCDLIFTSDAAGTQLLSWEFETWAPATGASNIWVNVPNLANGTVVYAWYGKPTVTSLQTTPSSTWTNYQAVYHMKENPAGTAPQLNDSTGNGNNATMNGTTLASQQQPGEIDGSVNFEGNTWASLASSSAFSFERTDSFTLSGWFNIPANASATLLSKFPTEPNSGWALMQQAGAASPSIQLGLFGANNAATFTMAHTPSVSLGTWHYVVATYSGTSTVAGMTIYVDGVKQTLTTVSNNLATTMVNNLTPTINSRTSDSYLSSDTVDELRISAKGVVLTPAWVTASYNNQSKPSAFLSAVTGLTNAGGVAATLSPASVAFGNEPVNATSAAQTATLTNSGTGSLTIASISIAGANPGDFAIATGANACGATLAAGASCSIYVTFTPASAASFSATLSVADNAAGSPQTAALTGTGVAPSATLTSPLAFPNTAVGATSAALAATLSNPGGAPLNNIAITLGGSNPGDFAIETGANACGATLAAGASCSIYVTFTPASAASFTATLSVADNAAGSPQTAALTGTGVSSAPTTWPNGYLYQATFTVAAGQVPSAQSNFPMLISGTYADFASTANGGRISNTCTQTVGNSATPVPCDLIFTSDAAGTQLLSWEFETWAPATGASNIWVNVPNLANGTVVYAWYGKPTVTSLQTTPSSTWTNYQAVYHMKENPAGTAPQLNDSTGNGNNATMNGTTLATQQQPGEIDGSVNFEGNTWASLASSSAFSFERTDSFTLSGWFNIPANASATLLSKFPTEPNSGWALMQQAGAASPSIQLGLFGANNAATFTMAHTPSVSLGAWHYVVATYSGTSTVAGMTIYVDGVKQTLTTVSNNLATTMVNNLTPTINSRTSDSYLSSDTVDELRISAKGVVLTQAWVTASYNNQSKPGSFVTAVTGLTNP